MEGTSERVLLLEIPPRPEFVAVVRLVVATAAKARRTLDDDRIADLALALSEACTNAIEAHDGHAEAERVTVTVDEFVDRLVIVVSDRGPGFDPLEVQTPPPADDPERLRFERGLGIPIIRTLVDEVTFRSGDDGTTVTMTVRCPPSLEPSDLADINLTELLGPSGPPEAASTREQSGPTLDSTEGGSS